ncbi:MAG: hypothetical protein J6Y80_04940 [Victivallales bacterium]|nr:hypothetical protein [Victivallales bacterium]
MRHLKLQHVFRFAKWTVLGIGIFVLLAVLVIELAVNFWGYPQWVRRRAEAALLPPEQGICIIGWLKGGPFTGFEAEDVIVDVQSPVGIVHVNIPSLELRLSIPALFKLQVRPTHLNIRDVLASLQLNRTDKLELTSLTGQLRLNTHDTLQASIKTQAAGINLGVNATIYNGLQIVDLIQAAGQDENGSPEDQAARREAWLANLRETLDSIHQTLAKISFGTNDTFVQANVRCDLTDLDKTTVQGEYSMNDALLHDIVVPKQRGGFRYANKVFRLEDLQVLLSPTEVVKGTLEYHLRTQKLSAKTAGQVFPDTIARLFDAYSTPLPPWLRFKEPIAFEASLNHTGHDWNAVQPTIRFSCKGLEVAGLEILGCSGVLSIHDQTLQLQDASVELDYRQRETIHGDASWNLQTSELAAHLSGTVFLPRVLQNLGYTLPRNSLLEFHSGTAFELTLKPSKLDWQNFHLEGTIRQPRWKLTNYEFRNTEAQFSLQDGELNLARLSTQPMVGTETSLTANVKCQLKDLFSRRRSMPAYLHAWLHTTPDKKQNPELVLEFVGTIQTNLQQNTLALYNGHGGIYPHAVCNLLENILHLDPIYQLDWLHCDQPGTFDFDIPAWPIGDWGQFQLEGKTHFDQCTFQEIPLDTLDATFCLDIEQFKMTDIKLNGSGGKPQASCMFTIEYSPFAITIQNLKYSGDPILIKPFIVAPEAMELYQNIWEPVTWSQNSTGIFNLDLVEYRDLPAQRSWLLNIQGFADATDFQYRQFEVPKAHCRLDLALPTGGLNIHDVVFDNEKNDAPARLTGEAHFDFNKNLSGGFDLHFHEGELDVLELLRNAAESLVPVLEPFEISHQTYFDAHGNFVLGPNPYLRLTGSVESPYVKFQALELHNIKAKWLASPQFVHWDCSHAEFFGGKLSATGEYNHANGTGQCLANVKDIPLEELIRVTASTFHEHEAPKPATKQKKKAAQPEPRQIQPGLLDLEAKLAFYLNWAERPIHVEGNGQISIHDADLWHVPLLTSLGKILSVGTFNIFSRKKSSRLGTISKLKATVECQGKRIYIPEIKTDGTVVALSGSGEYDLEEKQMDFLISGHFLKNLSIINWLLRPLSWAFKAELVGKPSDYEWHLRSGWRKLEDKDE